MQYICNSRVQVYRERVKFGMGKGEGYSPTFTELSKYICFDFSVKSDALISLFLPSPNIGIVHLKPLSRSLYLKKKFI